MLTKNHNKNIGALIKEYVKFFKMSSEELNNNIDSRSKSLLESGSNIEYAFIAKIIDYSSTKTGIPNAALENSKKLMDKLINAYEEPFKKAIEKSDVRSAIEIIRIYAGVKQKDIAEKMGMPISTYHVLEMDSKKVDAEFVKKFISCFEYPDNLQSFFAPKIEALKKIANVSQEPKTVISTAEIPSNIISGRTPT